MKTTSLRTILLGVIAGILPLGNPAHTEDRYHSYDAMTVRLRELVSAHSSIASLTSIGMTAGKRNIWCVTIGGGNAEGNPAMLVVGGVEADRLIGSELSFRFIEHILTSYGRVDSVTRLIDSTTIYILPRVSPDASEGFFTAPLFQRSVNQRPSDDDRDGSFDEDPSEDLNGDGVITSMRIRDDRGEYLPHPDDPRVMRKADAAKGERGKYLLHPEGTDNDRDDRWNEDPLGGTDFNRNFPHRYAFFSSGSGPHQVSEFETRAIADFAFSHPHIAVVFSFSASDNLMNPWKKESSRSATPASGDDDGGGSFITSILPEDEPYYTALSSKFKDMTRFSSAPSPVTPGGSFVEWAYYHFGRWSFAANPWWIPDLPQAEDTTKQDTTKPKKIENEKKQEEQPAEVTDAMKALRWFDRYNMTDAFIPWVRIIHPDFPGQDVDVGGIKPYRLINPPADSINPLEVRFNPFLLHLAGILPKITIRNVKVERADDHVYRVNLDIFNEGYLPTNSAMGARSGWPRNVKVSLALSSDQKVVSGKPVSVLEPIHGSSGRKELTWLILAKSGSTVTVHAESPMAGSVSHEIILK